MPKTSARAAALLLAILAVTVMASGPCQAGETLSEIRSKRVLRCGVTDGRLGFAQKDKSGRWGGLEADFCRALAAAVLGDPEKVRFVPLPVASRFPALLSEDVDVLLRNTTWTMEREVLLRVTVPGILYYDAQGFLVPGESKFKELSDLDGARICVTEKTTHEKHLSDYFGARKLRYSPVVFKSGPEARAALVKGQCDAFTGDTTGLHAFLAETAGGPARFRILPGVISKEPLGPMVRRGDEEWATIVRWVLFALVEAEERGITSGNVRELQKAPGNSEMARFFSAGDIFVKGLGMRSDWLVRVIEGVGNYGEIFERNIGKKSVLKLERGRNALWTNGGLMYAPPFQ